MNNLHACPLNIAKINYCKKKNTFSQMTFREISRLNSTCSLALIGQAFSVKKKFEIVDDDDGRTPDHGFTICYPGEPSVQVS